MIKETYYKEFTIGKHYLSIGYDLRSFTTGLHINKYGFDINIYPFHIGMEWRGVEIDQALMAKVIERLKENK